MSKRQHRLEDEVGKYMQQYGRRRDEPEPSGRKHDRSLEREIKHMDPVALDLILRGEEPGDDVDGWRV